MTCERAGISQCCTKQVVHLIHIRLTQVGINTFKFKVEHNVYISSYEINQDFSILWQQQDRTGATILAFI